ncbi:MAG: hypothetical protein ACT6XY_11795 [Phreatobacter sp.]|uniref:hypothetical protein n=1 Tax=Phreatobacter sp. TaxID=1966341 RepID=UPI00403583A8
MDYMKHFIDRFVFFLRYDKRLLLSFCITLAPAALAYFVEGASLFGWSLSGVGFIWLLYESYVSYIAQRKGHAEKIKFPTHLSRRLPPHAFLVKCNDGVAISYSSINSNLDALRISFYTIDGHYQIPQNIREIYGNIFNYKNIRPDTTNDEKVRLCSDIDNELSTSHQDISLAIQKTDYFSSYITNEAGNLAVRRVDGSSRANGIDYYYRDGRILALSESSASNHIGVSLLVVSSDGYLLYQLQGEQEQGKQMFGPTASGSLDWADVEKAALVGGNDFSRLVRIGMLRELTEETSALELDPQGKIRLTGYCRYLTRGGKPEFFGFARVSQRHDEVRIVPRRERKKVSRIETYKIDCKSRVSFLQSLSAFHKHIKSQMIEHTLSLETSAILLERYIRELSDDRYQEIMC